MKKSRLRVLATVFCVMLCGALLSGCIHPESVSRDGAKSDDMPRPIMKNKVIVLCGICGLPCS